MPAQLDFKAIAESVDVEAVAKYLGLTFIKGRADCPACESEHAIELVPDTNTFKCYAGTPRPGNKYLTGDCIALYAHIKGYEGQYRAAKELSELFASATAPRNTSTTPPQKPEARTAKAQPAPAPRKQEYDFDPAKFAASLQYNDDVAALGVSEADAEALGIGMKRGKLYVAMRYDNGQVAGYVEFTDKVKLPDKLLPHTANVVKFPRSA